MQARRSKRLNGSTTNKSARRENSSQLHEPESPPAQKNESHALSSGDQVEEENTVVEVNGSDYSVSLHGDVDGCVYIISGEPSLC